MMQDESSDLSFTILRLWFGNNLMNIKDILAVSFLKKGSF